MDSLLNFQIEEDFSLRYLFTENDIKNLEEEILLLVDYFHEKNYSNEDMISIVVDNLLKFELDGDVELCSFFDEENILNFREECNLLLQN